MGTLLEVRRVSRFFGGLAALAEVSLSVGEGEVVGLIGPNGAGKTTALSIISGFLRPSAGSVRYCDREIAGLPAWQITRLGVARTFQATTVFAGATVFDNLARAALVRASYPLFGQLVGSHASRAVEKTVRAKVEALAEEFALSCWLSRPAGSLSYGHQKRLGVALALATEPQLLLLDEPVAGLNPQECTEFATLLKRLQQNRSLSLLLVEHHIQFVTGLCQRVVALDHGRKIADAPPAELLSNPAVVEAYLGSEDDDFA